MSSFTVFGDVDRVNPWQGNAYITLIEKAGAQNLILKAFIPEEVIIRDQIELKPKIKILITGSVSLNKSEIQLNASSATDIGIGKLHRQIEIWKKQFKNLFERVKKPLPLLCSRIALISNSKIQGFGDFDSHLKFGALDVFERKMQGEKTAEGIASAIEDINDLKQHDIIAIVRGGGSFSDLFEFNLPILLQSIAASQIPVCVAVGHESDILLADFAADARFSTPTHLAKELTLKAENLLRQTDDKIKRIKDKVLNMANECEAAVNAKLDIIRKAYEGIVLRGRMRRAYRKKLAVAVAVVIVLIVVIIFMLWRR